MRIRYILGDFPWPLDSGPHLRQFHVLRALAAVGEVDVIAFPHRAEEIPREVAELCHRVFVSHVGIKRPYAAKTKLSRLMQLVYELQGNPLGESAMRYETLGDEICATLRKHYDITWIARLQTALRIGYVGSTSSVLDLDDVEHRKVLRAATELHQPLRQRMRLMIEGHAWRRAEMQVLESYERIAVCSEMDRQYLSKPSVTVIPNGVAVEKRVSFDLGVPGRMVFVGQMSYWPNDDAMRYFLRQIFPLIQEVEKRAHVVIVGSSPSAELRAMADGKSIHVLGYVSDVRPYVKAAALSIVPLRIGGGTRLKILEALALKKPVVSTRIGMEGLALQDGEQITIADSPRAFANSCIALLANPERRMALAESGYSSILYQYDWSVIEKKIADLIHTMSRRSEATRGACHSCGWSRS